MKKLFIYFLFLFLTQTLFSQIHTSAQAHQGEISAIVSAGNFENSYFSTGKDGFLIKWTEENIGTHYQISDLEIKNTAVSPNGKEIAVYETGKSGINRISIWNWETQKRKFTRRFKDVITSLSYSANGTYLIAGTASVNGTYFIRTDDYTIIKKIKSATGAVSYSVTSPSEKTAAMYSPAGTLTFYDLVSGQIKKRFTTIQGLSQPVLFNNFLFLAGISNSKIYIISGITGEILTSVNAQNPIILNSKNDKNFYFLESDIKGNYALKVFENTKEDSFNLKILKIFKGPKGEECISCGIKNGNEIITGSKSGHIYKISIASEGIETSPYTRITQNIYNKILDINTDADNFYFLTKEALFKSSYPKGNLEMLYSNTGYTQSIYYNEKIILWRKGSKKPVLLFDCINKKFDILFQPETAIQSIRIFKDILVEIESSSIINIYDLNLKKFKNIYNGTGLQDAVIGSNGKLYVGKSVSDTADSVMLSIDLSTGETIAIPLQGDIIFSMNEYLDNIYGISIESSGIERKTSLFKYNIKTKQVSYILKWADEDIDAFTYLYYPFLYTNIGKDGVISLNLTSSKTFILKRAISIPLKVCRNNNSTIILNKDGSLSWYKDDINTDNENWYLLFKEGWEKF